MQIMLKDIKRLTQADIEAFLAGSKPLDFSVQSAEAYLFIESVLANQHYSKLSRKSKGSTRRFLTAPFPCTPSPAHTILKKDNKTNNSTMLHSGSRRIGIRSLFQARFALESLPAFRLIYGLENAPRPMNAISR